LEALHALYSRSHFADDEFLQLVVPLYDAEYVTLFRRLFAWSTVQADDIDDDKYLFAKKFAEVGSTTSEVFSPFYTDRLTLCQMISCLGNYLDRKYSSLPTGLNVEAFVEFLLQVGQSQSLVVSIPILVTWTRLLGNPMIGPTLADTPLVGPLLELCSSRMIRYENLPEDTEDPSYVFLVEDTDTMPERHAFLGNYRRYSAQIIEGIVQLKLVDAFHHVLGQAETVLQGVANQPPLDSARPFQTMAYDDAN
jgi:exportin-5